MHIQKGKILYDSLSMTFWKRQNYGDSKKYGHCQMLRWREDPNRQSTEDFQGGESTLYDKVIMEPTMPTVSLKVKYNL